MRSHTGKYSHYALKKKTKKPKQKQVHICHTHAGSYVEVSKPWVKIVFTLTFFEVDFTTFACHKKIETMKKKKI